MEDVHPDSSLFSDNPEMRGMFRLGPFIIPMWIVILLGLVAAFGLGFKPVYRSYRAYRAEQNYQAALTAAIDGNWSAARDKARSVLLVRGQDLAAYRIWVRALGKLGAPDAYQAAAELFTSPHATREDLLETLRVMAIQAPQVIALSAYSTLPPPYLAQADFRAAISPLLVQRGEFALAEANLREVAQTSDPPSVRLELLRVLCSRPDATRLGEARQIFADLIAANADAQAMSGLLLLGAVPGGLAGGAPLPDLSAWLDTQPQATALHHLHGMTPLLGVSPEKANRCYQAAVLRFGASDPGALGLWLGGCGQAAMAADVLEAAAITSADAYLARLHALMSMAGEPAAAAALAYALANPPVMYDHLEMELVQAAFEFDRGDAIAAAAAWARALSLAALDTSRNRCIDVARAADRCGANDVAETAWVAAMRMGMGQLPLYRDLLPIISSLVAKGRSEDLLVMFRCLQQLEPANPELQNNYYYFVLIHGIMSPAQVVKLLAKPAGQNEHPACNSTLMLAELLDDRPADALARLSRLQASTQVPPMMKRALEGTARMLTSDAELGSALLRDVDWSAFMSQERIVFRGLLGQLNVGE